MTQSNQTARTQALQQMSTVPVEASSLVSYQSNGRVLVIGDAQAAIAAANQIAQPIQAIVLASSGESNTAPEGIPVLHAKDSAIELSGHLGEFKVQLEKDTGPLDLGKTINPDQPLFDLVLDLNPSPLIPWEVPPFGYYPVGDDELRLTNALTELADMIGEFEKPKFFDYNPNICAHGSSGISGCTRCIDACPTGAITSLIDKISVDPYLCQGGGSCTTACPSGAITYAYPKPADSINRLRVLIRSYKEAGGANVAILFHDEAGASDVDIENLPGNIIPLEFEEIGGVGMELWLSALAFGASKVLLLTPPQLPQSVRAELSAQLETAHALLAGLAFPEPAISLIDSISSVENAQTMPEIPAATYGGQNDKRTMLQFALDHLIEHAPTSTAETIPLPVQAPFGEIKVDPAACTLCMACVSICPVKALFDGAGKPGLQFMESACVQCGICESACPESAITRSQRFVTDTAERNRRRILHEEAPFCCVSCGTPFATQSVIDVMMTKLEGHWMFKDEKALRRLKMCGDCRVRDMMMDENKLS